MIGIAKLLTQHGQSLEGVRDLHFMGHAHAAVQLHRFLTDMTDGITDPQLGG